MINFGTKGNNILSGYGDVNGNWKKKWKLFYFSFHLSAVTKENLGQ
jgi:hypothetical protein